MKEKEEEELDLLRVLAEEFRKACGDNFLTVNQIAKRINKDKPVVIGIISALQEENYVLIEASPSVKYKFILSDEQRKQALLSLKKFYESLLIELEAELVTL